MKIRVGGAFEDVTSGQVRIAGAWRRLTGAKAYISGAWKDVASFLQPLTLDVSPSSDRAIVVPSAFADTIPITATPTGGLGPYTYAWTRVSGSTGAALSPTSATSQFRAFITSVGEFTSTFLCTVTDANGNTATDNVEVVFEGVSFS
jgi:hypothetical protein